MREKLTLSTKMKRSNPFGECCPLQFKTRIGQKEIDLGVGQKENMKIVYGNLVTMFVRVHSDIGPGMIMIARLGIGDWGKSVDMVMVNGSVTEVRGSSQLTMNLYRYFRSHFARALGLILLMNLM